MSRVQLVLTWNLKNLIHLLSANPLVEQFLFLLLHFIYTDLRSGSV